MKPDVSKIVFYAAAVGLILSLSFAVGLYSAHKKTVVYRALLDVKKKIELVSEEASTLTKLHPKHMVQPARFEGQGVTVNNVPGGEQDLVFLSGFFEDTNEHRLIRRDGSILARWPVNYSEIFPDPSHLRKPPKTDWNVDMDGALMLPDGSVVFSFELCGLVKLDRCGNVVWSLGRESHHSVEPSEKGGFWVPGRRWVPKKSDSPFPPFQPPFYEDTIMKVSYDGRVTSEISVPGLFYENGLETLLTATGHHFEVGMKWDREILHLNKVHELSSDIAEDFPLFEEGDLALSIRELNMVLVIDPDTRDIKWWRIGPWRRQHSSLFKPGGTITVFNNNAYRTAFGTSSDDSCVSCLSVPRISNIIEIDPVTGDHRILYGDQDGQEMLTIIRGKHESTPNGGLLITEFEAGRVFETDSRGRVIWEYINRYDSDEVAELTQARMYPATYFEVSDWSCN
ncbi:hypothetical protein D3OALGA1CA_2687 [Olavius algarvensis associated proteobacterium Delta 3]|nr:hypothetical protein D3OALGA1CA_2687 [Olavius algarvensis associated proteobacterium Delta 3]